MKNRLLAILIWLSENVFAQFIVRFQVSWKLPMISTSFVANENLTTYYLLVYAIKIFQDNSEFSQQLQT
jgi:F0F1-type ATP synthase assembly protein I